MNSTSLFTGSELRSVVEVRNTISSFISAVLDFCSSLMGEQVTLLQLKAVLSVIIGLGMAPAVFGAYPWLGIIGMVFLVVGAAILASKENL